MLSLQSGLREWRHNGWKRVTILSSRTMRHQPLAIAAEG